MELLQCQVPCFEHPALWHETIFTRMAALSNLVIARTMV
jgi:hypothetical protein